MLIWDKAETVTESIAETIAETVTVVEEVQQDLEQLKPNVVLETMKGWIPGLIQLGYRLLVVAIIVAVGFRIAKAVRQAAGKSFERMNMELSLQKFLLSAIYVAICGLTIFVAAEKLGISSASIIAILGSAGVALSLSMQNMLANFVGGIIILIIKPYKIGDYIICGSAEGTVSSIGLVYTRLSTMDNREIVLPNGSMSNTNLTNVTAQKQRRLEIKVGIGYQSDLRKAKAIMQDLFEKHPMILQERGVVVFVDALADSAVIIGARGWVDTDNYWTAKCELTEEIKLAFDDGGIEIPFNQLDVNVKK